MKNKTEEYPRIYPPTSEVAHKHKKETKEDKIKYTGKKVKKKW